MQVSVSVSSFTLILCLISINKILAHACQYFIQGRSEQSPSHCINIRPHIFEKPLPTRRLSVAEI